MGAEVEGLRSCMAQVSASLRRISTERRASAKHADPSVVSALEEEARRVPAMTESCK